MINATTRLRGRIGPLLSSPWAMVVAAMAIRLAVMPFTYHILLNPWHDHCLFGCEFGRIARSIVEGRGFSSPYPAPTGPSAIVGPVYAYLLAGIFKFFGVYTASSAVVALTLNNLLSSLTCVPIFFVARRAFGSATAVWAGWIWAFFPYSIAGSDVWVWETVLTTLLLTLLLLYTLDLERSVSYLVWIGYGLLWAVAGLTSAATLATLPFWGLWILVRQRRLGYNCVGQVIAASLVFLAAVAPWSLRCSRLYGRFVAFRGNFGLELLVGNNSDTSIPENWKVMPSDNPAELERVQQVGEPAYMTEKGREAREYIATHPLRYAGQTLRRILYTWTDLWNFPPHLSLAESGVADVLTKSALSGLAFAGVVFALRRRKEYTIPLLIPLVFFPIVYCLTHTDARYRHPIDPVMVILAVFGAICLLGNFRHEGKELLEDETILCAE